MSAQPLSEPQPRPERRRQAQGGSRRPAPRWARRPRRESFKARQASSHSSDGADGRARPGRPADPARRATGARPSAPWEDAAAGANEGRLAELFGPGDQWRRVERRRSIGLQGCADGGGGRSGRGRRAERAPNGSGSAPPRPAIRSLRPEARHAVVEIDPKTCGAGASRPPSGSPPAGPPPTTATRAATGSTRRGPRPPRP